MQSINQLMLLQHCRSINAVGQRYMPCCRGCTAGTLTEHLSLHADRTSTEKTLSKRCEAKEHSMHYLLRSPEGQPPTRTTTSSPNHSLITSLPLHQPWQSSNPITHASHPYHYANHGSCKTHLQAIVVPLQAARPRSFHQPS